MPFKAEKFREKKVQTVLQIVLTMRGPWGIGRGATKMVFGTLTLS
jgi:hypothetical protein